jgi:hypothetical protein
VVESLAVANDGKVFLGLLSYDPTLFPPPPEHRVVCLSSSGTLLSSVLLSASNESWSPLKVEADVNAFALALWTRGTSVVDYEAELTKTDSSGNVVWTRTVDAAPTSGEKAIDLVVDGAGNSFTLTQPSSSGPSAVSKFDSNGALLWSQPWSASALAIGTTDMALTPDGGVVVVAAVPATINALDANGAHGFEVHPYTHFPGLPVDLRYLEVDGDGSIAAFGRGGAMGAVAMLRPGGSVAWTRVFGQGAFTDAAFASDGTLWLIQSISAGGFGEQSVLAHFARTGELLGDAKWWSPQSSGLANLIAGTAGDMRVCSSRKLVPHDPNHSEAVVFAFDFAGQRLWAWSAATTLFYSTRAMAQAPNGRMVITGRVLLNTEDARTVQFDTSETPRGYCAAETNSLGCTPEVVFTGLPRASATSGFSVVVSGVLNHASGLLLYGVNGATNVPFHSGTLCVQPPLARTPLAGTGGNPGAGDCSGAISLDMNAFASGALGGSPSPALSVAGTRVWSQAWSRDPGSSSGTNLSSALTYVVLP